MFKKIIKILLFFVLVFSVYLLAIELKSEVSSKKRTMWQKLLFEDFESGSIPSDWTVVDGNGDDDSWEINTGEGTGAPPDFDTAYAFYEDWTQNSYASVPGEDLITPKFFATSFDSIRLIYSMRYSSQPGVYDDTFRLYRRVFEGEEWKSWVNVVQYNYYVNEWDTVSFWIGIADSIQFMWRYLDHHQNSIEIGIDNVSVKGHLKYGGTHDIGVVSLNSPTSLVKLDTSYAVSSTFRNIGDSVMTFTAHTEIVSASGSPVYFSSDSNNVTLLPDSSIEIDFGNWTMTIADSCNYISSSTTSDSTDIDDTLGMLVLADIDFKTDTILMPPPYCDTNIPYDVIARFKNEGVSDYTVNLLSEVTLDGSPVFSKDSTDVLIPAGDYIDVNFGSVIFNEYADYECRINTSFPYDIDFSNDSFVSTGRVSPWEIITELPIRLEDEAVVFDGTYVYVIGGNTPDSTLKSTFIYNPLDKSWDRVSDLPVPLCEIDACILGDTIYVPGGETQATYIGEHKILDSLYKYSISYDTWTVSPCPRDSVVYYSCVSANGKVYKIGGRSYKTGGIVGYTREYIPGSGWTNKANMPFPRKIASGWTKNDTIYIAGGLRPPDPGIVSSLTQFYDPMNNLWASDSTLFAYLPYEIWGVSTAMYKGMVYLMSGYGGKLYDSVFYYNNINNSWEPYYPLLRGEIYVDGVGIEGLGDSCDGIYLFGGSSAGVQALINPQPDIDTIPDTSGLLTSKPLVDTSGYLVIPSNIALNSVNLTYKGTTPGTVIVRDITGRVVKEYKNIKPETHLSFGDKEISSGIYFVGIKGNEERRKVVLVK